MLLLEGPTAAFAKECIDLSPYPSFNKNKSTAALRVPDGFHVSAG
jgi:hypothetical protein